VLDFNGLPIFGILTIFALSSAMIWIAGTSLAVHGDALADRLGLNKVFVGLVFLATVTELPEIVTTITAAQAGNAALVLGNMFGGITMQTAILAVADVFAVRYALTSWPRKPTHALLAVMLIVLLSSLLAITFLGDVVLVSRVGLGAICLFCGYPLVMFLLRNSDRKATWVPVELPDDDERSSSNSAAGRRFPDTSNRVLIYRSIFFSFMILTAGVALALSADALAVRGVLGSSFIGVTLLAAATSLPELSTTLAAARIGAYSMAIANIFGSNLIMVALLLPADLAYRRGPILSEADSSAQFSIATGIIVTAIYVVGILMRRTPSLFGAGLDSWLVMTVYVGSIVALFFMQ
jgi:cation:H+ antiporter